MRVDREGPVHKAILDYLETVLPNVLWHHSPNESDMPNADTARMKAAAKGTIPGWPDIEGVCGGRFLSFEIKAEGGVLRDEQRKVGKALIATGGHWAVVRSIDDVREALAEWQIQTREAVT